MRADFPRPTGEQLERKGIKKREWEERAGRWGAYGARGDRASSPIDSISPPLLQHLGLMRRVDLHPNYILPFFFLTAYPLPLTGPYTLIRSSEKV